MKVINIYEEKDGLNVQCHQPTGAWEMSLYF